MASVMKGLIQLIKRINYKLIYLRSNVCRNYYYRFRTICTSYCYYVKKCHLETFFSIFKIINGCISTLVSLYRVVASFVTSDF